MPEALLKQDDLMEWLEIKQKNKLIDALRDMGIKFKLSKGKVVTTQTCIDNSFMNQDSEEKIEFE